MEINTNYINVTNIINNKIGKSFQVNNELFGDPCHGVLKQLLILDKNNCISINIEGNYYNNSNNSSKFKEFLSIYNTVNEKEEFLKTIF